LLYSLAISARHKVVIFQNNEDLYFLSKTCGLLPSQSILISGSGVDLKLFHPTPLPEGQPVVLMASRLLKTKGVHEFVQAATLLRQRDVFARFQLAGEPDFDNPASVTRNDLRNWASDGLVEILGFRSDINQLFSQAHIICLPSYYPEGLPKVLCEAAACGRVVVTTDQPGCRDAIDNGVTGLLVPPRDSLALADAFHILLSDLDLISNMGIAARQRAEQLFDVDLIVEQHLDVYRSLSADLPHLLND